MGFISDLIINVSAFRIKVGEKLITLANRIGVLTNLTTTNKTNLVSAINEVKNSVPDANNVVFLTTNQSINGNKKFQSLQVMSDIVTNIASGWNRIATLTGRGYVEVSFQTTGGSQTPANHVIKINASWSSSTWNIDVDRNGTSTYIKQARVVNDNSVIYLEVEFTSVISTSRLGKYYLKGNHDLELTFITPIAVTELVGELYAQSFSHIQGQTVESVRFRASNFIVDGGTSSQFLKANGSVDSNTYATTTQLGNYALLSQVYTQSQALGLFVGLNGVQTINDTKTFSSSPIVPNGTLNNHAVNFGQLTSYVSDRANVRLSNVASDLSATEKNAIKNKLGVTDTTYSNGTGIDLTNYTFSLTAQVQNDINKGVLAFGYGNHASAGYALASQLANYVPVNGAFTINGTKTFSSSPIVPNATLNAHAVNLGQLNTLLAGYLTSVPLASTTVIGGGKLFSNAQQTVTPNAVSNTASRTYAVQLNANGQLVVNVPWTGGGASNAYSINTTFTNVDGNSNNGLIEHTVNAYFDSSITTYNNTIETSVLSGPGMWINPAQDISQFYGLWGVRIANTEPYVTRGTIVIGNDVELTTYAVNGRRYLVCFYDESESNPLFFGFVNINDMLDFKKRVGDGAHLILLGKLSVYDGINYLKVDPQFF